MVSFLWPQIRLSLRQAYMPLHVFWGVAIFIMAGISSLTGIVMYSTQGAEEHS